MLLKSEFNLDEPSTIPLPDTDSKGPPATVGHQQRTMISGAAISHIYKMSESSAEATGQNLYKNSVKDEKGRLVIIKYTNDDLNEDLPNSGMPDLQCKNTGRSGEPTTTVV